MQSYKSNQIKSKNQRTSIFYCYIVCYEIFFKVNASLLIDHNIFQRENYTRTKGEEFYFDKSINLLKERLRKLITKKNKAHISNLLVNLETKENPKKPDVNWGKVFETCNSCYFGKYPTDRFIYFNFSLIFMQEEKIEQMINYENGIQWKYALMAIKGGDSFSIEKNLKSGEDILDRRIATYIMTRWKDSNIPEIQELLSLYGKLLKQ